MIIEPGEENAALGVQVADILMLADQPGWLGPGLYLLARRKELARLEGPVEREVLHKVTGINRPADAETAARWLVQFRARCQDEAAAGTA